MRQFAEIAFAQAQQDGAVHLGVAADPVMDARVERLAVLVMPGLTRLVAVLGEHGVRTPVFSLARQVIAAFEDQDALARWGEPVGERAAAGAAADDDYVVTLSGHGRPPRVAQPRTRSGKCSSCCC